MRDDPSDRRAQALNSSMISTPVRARIERACGLVGQDDSSHNTNARAMAYALLLASGTVVRQVSLCPSRPRARAALRARAPVFFQAYRYSQRQLLTFRA